MLSVQEAYDIVRKNLPPWERGSAGLKDLQAAVSAESLVADRAYPAVDRVMMDGIAVAWVSYQQGRREFTILGICAAGAAQRSLSDAAGCFEIMTGAALPLGADLVIPVEQLEVRGGVARVVREQAYHRFENVHRQGSDCGAGQVILQAGKRMSGPHWGIAASFGYSQMQVLVAPRVKLISTGDEIVGVEDKPLPHQIRRSNVYALRASLLQFGYQDVDLDHLSDDQEKLRVHYQENVPHYDIMIYSGGVSMGKFDYLPQLWADFGVTKLFHGVRQRPGKPLWFGKDERSQTVIVGLPGNPISSLVCLHRYFLQQHPSSSGPRYARLGADIIFEKKLSFFVPVRLEYREDAVVIAQPLPAKNSGEFTALADSDGFIELPEEKSLFKTGESYPFFSWSRP